MKLTLDEHVKHRLIGIAVILSIAAIFAPAMIKKSNQRLDENTTLFVKLPPKPTMPKIVMPEEKTMFKRVKVAKVDVPKVPSESAELTLSRAEYLKPKPKELEKIQSVAMQEKKISANLTEEHPINPTSNQNTKTNLPIEPADTSYMLHKSEINPIGTTSSISVQRSKVKMTNAKAAEIKKTTFTTPIAPSASNNLLARKKNKVAVAKSKKESYLVQLASFSKKQNADQLINKLRAKGYRASYNKVTTPSGLVYKVVVGETAQRQQAQVLKQRLAATINLNGMIVTNIG